MTPNYNKLKTCPKCETKKGYIEKYVEKNQFYNGEDLKDVMEFIKRTCKNCGYEWDVKCKNSKKGKS